MEPYLLSLYLIFDLNDRLHRSTYASNSCYLKQNNSTNYEVENGGHFTSKKAPALRKFEHLWLVSMKCISHSPLRLIISRLTCSIWYDFQHALSLSLGCCNLAADILLLVPSKRSKKPHSWHNIQSDWVLKAVWNVFVEHCFFFFNLKWFISIITTLQTAPKRIMFVDILSVNTNMGEKNKKLDRQVLARESCRDHVCR